MPKNCSNCTKMSMWNVNHPSVCIIMSITVWCKAIHTQVDAALGVNHDTLARGLSKLSRPLIYLDVALLTCPAHNETHDLKKYDLSTDKKKKRHKNFFYQSLLSRLIMSKKFFSSCVVDLELIWSHLEISELTIKSFHLCLC